MFELPRPPDHHLCVFYIYYVKELQQFNLFSISQIGDKKNQVLFIDTECLVLSKDFQLPDDSMVVLKVPRKHNLYTINLNDLCPRGNLACLVAHGSFDESVKWHRRMAHVNYKNMNRLVKGNLVRGFPSKLFKNGHTCVACCKGFVGFSFWSIRMRPPIFKNFINLVENQLNKKVKAIRCDNGTEFKNAHMIELCGSKWIKREYSNPRTPQQNRIAERKNRTLIEAARTMLADYKLPTMFWTKAVRTACYVLNRVFITSPHNKTPYALLTGNIPTVSHFKPFGCHVTILNTSDHLGKFDGKADEGYIVGYSASNKAYRVYNVPNKRVQETMNLWFIEDKPKVQGLGHEWYFDLDYLTDSLGYKHVSANQSAGTQGNTTNSVGTQDPIDTPGDKVDDSPFPSADEIFRKELAKLKDQEQRVTSDAEELRTPAGVKAVLPGCIPVPTGRVPVPVGSVPVPTGSITVPTDRIPLPAGDTTILTDDVPVHSSNSTDSMFDGELTTRFPCPSDLGNHNPSPGIFSSSSYDDKFDTALNNVASSVEALEDPSWVDAMQEEMQQFKFQNVWVLVDLPPDKYAIGTKWILKNKRDARGIVVRNKARLVAQGHQQEEDDIIFGSTKKEWYDEFEALMKGEFQMSAMGELTFFIGLQVQQRPDGIFIHQDKYVQEILHKFDLGNVRTATTPYEAPKPKSKSESDSPVNVHLYRSMIEAVKKIFKYLKGQPKLGFWYPKESPLMLEAYSDSDYAGANKDRKFTTGGSEYVVAANCCGQFWSTATLRESELGPPAILATIDKTPYTITEALVRSRLQLTDDGGVVDLPISEIYSGMDNLGYVTEGKLTFSKTSFHLSGGEGAEVAAQDVPYPVPAPDQSPSHFPTPSRPQSPDPVAPVLEHDHSSAQPETAAGSFPTTEGAPLGGDFHPSPPRSSHTPPAGQPSGGAEDPITLTALSSVVSTLVQKVHSLEAELHDHKKLFKDVVGNDSDPEDSTTQDMDLDALRALANAAVAADSDIPSGNTSQVPPASPCAPTAGTSEVPPAPFAIPTGASGVAPGAFDVYPGPSVTPTAALAVPADSPKVPTDVPSDSPNVPAGASSKGKSPMVEEDIPVTARSFRQREEDRLGEEAAKRLHEEEMAELERERAEAQRKRQQDVLESAKFYNEDDWLNIRAQVEANASLSQTLLGDDVTEDNFLARMAAAIYNTCRTMVYVKSFSDAQLLQEFEKIHKVQSQSQIQAFNQTLKRPEPVLEEPFTKRPKSQEAYTPSMPEVSVSPVVTSPPSSRIRRKSLGRKPMHKSKSTPPTLDLDAPAQTFLKVVVDEDSDDEDYVDEVWSAVVGWELLSTPLGEINALYRIDGSTKHFSTLRQILHLVDLQDLMKLYGLVVQYYEHHPAVGAGLLF
nr:hypothetical protein [Tanacetum cinerariifolium]